MKPDNESIGVPGGMPVPLENCEARGFLVGEKVVKDGGDYVFHGQVRASFQKQSGAWRYVVENPDGLLHIFSGKQLRRA